MFGKGPISWCSRNPIVSLSTTEAEYIAAECCKELIYLKNILESIANKRVKAKLLINNQGALIKNGILHRRSKHIDVRFHFISEKYSEGIIGIEYCLTEFTNKKYRKI